MLVQPMVAGVELALGVGVGDPVLGPLVMIAAGGIATDIWDDRVFLVLRCRGWTRARAQEPEDLAAARGIPGGGPRGRRRAGATRVAVAHLASDVRELAELDLNPVMVDERGCAVVDVKMRLLAPSGHDSSAPRQLRPLR